MTASDPVTAFTYILPVRLTDASAPAELTEYLRWIGGRAELIVVDASPAALFDVHHREWGTFAYHMPVASDIQCTNGKVRGVLTGLRRASHERIIIADDDVRYDARSLASTVRSLDDAHVVRPQNYFDPLPWHAVVDTGRILLNRALDGDWPGTLAVRRSVMQATGGYDGDVLFENLELVRTVVAAGGRPKVARGILVRRIPPTAPHFLGQRVRQAYDEFARPGRMLVQLAILPALIVALFFRRLDLVLGGAGLTVLMAERGRWPENGRTVFRVLSSLLSPLWVLERAVCSWLALGQRVVRGGVSYAGGILRVAATPMRELRRRHAGAVTSTSIGLKEPLLDSSAEQAVMPTMRSISARTSK